MSARVKKVMTQPINLIFRFLQNVSSMPRAVGTGRQPRAAALPCPARLPPPPCHSPPRRHLRRLTQLAPQRTRIAIWLYDNPSATIEGRIVGFDEYMNLVLDEATEIDEKKDTREEIGRILLKGDTITLMRSVTVES